MKRYGQAGFAVIWVIIIVLVLAAVGYATYYVMTKNQDKKDASQADTSKHTDTTKSEGKTKEYNFPDWNASMPIDPSLNITFEPVRGNSQTDPNGTPLNTTSYAVFAPSNTTNGNKAFCGTLLLKYASSPNEQVSVPDADATAQLGANVYIYTKDHNDLCSNGVTIGIKMGLLSLKEAAQ